MPSSSAEARSSAVPRSSRRPGLRGPDTWSPGFAIFPGPGSRRAVQPGVPQSRAQRLAGSRAPDLQFDPFQPALGIRRQRRTGKLVHDPLQRRACGPFVRPVPDLQVGEKMQPPGHRLRWVIRLRQQLVDLAPRPVQAPHPIRVENRQFLAVKSKPANDSDAKYTIDLYRLLDKSAIESRIAELRERSKKIPTASKSGAQKEFFSAFELFQAGEFRSAHKAFTQALELDPTNPQGHFLMAETLSRLNDKNTARLHYRYAVAFGTGSKESFIAEDRLASFK